MHRQYQLQLMTEVLFKVTGKIPKG
jgi:hypothetical protein